MPAQAIEEARQLPPTARCWKNPEHPMVGLVPLPDVPPSWVASSRESVPIKLSMQKRRGKQVGRPWNAHRPRLTLNQEPQWRSLSFARPPNPRGRGKIRTRCAALPAGGALNPTRAGPQSIFNYLPLHITCLPLPPRPPYYPHSCSSHH